jgi:hypothetical protein
MKIAIKPLHRHSDFVVSQGNIPNREVASSQGERSANCCANRSRMALVGQLFGYIQSARVIILACVFADLFMNPCFVFSSARAQGLLNFRLSLNIALLPLIRCWQRLGSWPAGNPLFLRHESLITESIIQGVDSS